MKKIGFIAFLMLLAGCSNSNEKAIAVNDHFYEINKTEKSKLKKLPKFTIERLDSIEELRNDKVRKTFFVDDPKKSGNQLLFLSFEKDKVTANTTIYAGWKKIKTQFPEDN